MAYKLQFEDASGVVHPEAYFFPAQVNIGWIDGTANITWLGYHSDQTLNKHPVGSKQFVIQGAAFYALAQRVLSGDSLLVVLDEVAFDTKDIKVEPETEGEDPTYISFFETATQVTPVLF